MRVVCDETRRHIERIGRKVEYPLTINQPRHPSLTHPDHTRDDDGSEVRGLGEDVSGAFVVEERSSDDLAPKTDHEIPEVSSCAREGETERRGRE